MYNSWLSSHYAAVFLLLLLLFWYSNKFWCAGMRNATQLCNLRYESICEGMSKSTSKHRLQSNVNHLHLFAYEIYFFLVQSSLLTIVKRLPLRRTSNNGEKR